MRKNFLSTIAAIILIVLVAGCGGETGGGGKGGPLPPCDPSALMPPTLISPATLEIVGSLTPTLSWAYPDSSCTPDSFHVYINEGPGYDVTGWEDTVSGSTTSWTPSTPLNPGSVYAWYVEAVSGSTTGPRSAGRFFTGPGCGPADLAAPVLLAPANGSTVTDLADMMWDNPSPCLVDGYRWALATDPGFAVPVYDYSYAMPLQRLFLEPSELTPCTTYYWHVAAILAYAESDFSATFSFYFNPAGSCPLTPLPNSITGKVFHDLCAIPEFGPLPDPLPEGCVPSGASAAANGILEYGEPGLAGVVVRLGSGACPAIDRGALLTDEFGNFQFLELPPGDYCVSVDALDTNNVDILIPGGWTAPPSGVGDPLARWEVTLGASGEVTDVNFAWDYQFLPMYDGTGTISGLVWNDLCAVSELATPPFPLPEGCVLDDWGRGVANGNFDPGEVGIPGLAVDLGHGPCPSAGFMTTTTNSDGIYTFEGVPPGDYCIRINAEDEVNMPILLPGRWTVVPSGHMGMTFRALTLPGGGSLADQDFAWDYSLAFYSGRIPFFQAEVPTNCRIGPTEGYGVQEFLEPGQAFPIIGRNPEGTWAYILMSPDPLEQPFDPFAQPYNPFEIPLGPVTIPDFPAGEAQFPQEPVDFVFLPDEGWLRCWVYIGIGSVEDDLGPLTIVQAPPLLLPEPDDEEPEEPAAPQPQPVVCTQFIDANSCLANGCRWVPLNVTPGGRCENP
ncbi:MAG: hypothetical protein JXB85_10420 [Anaerolineales bacterium]|nr:hypothetical protein [Anaerolineales bacterium]